MIPALGEVRRVACHWAEEIAAGTVGVADSELVVDPVR